MTASLPATSDSLAPAGTWTIDPDHSAVGFSVKHMMISNVKGRFGRFSGALVSADDGTVTIEGTIDSHSLDTGSRQRDDHLRSGDFFDAATHPHITFGSSAVTVHGHDRFLVSGQLSVRGITRPIDLTVERTGMGIDPWGGERVALEARGELNRGDFGLSWNQALETGGILVGERVSLVLELQLVRQ